MGEHVKPRPATSTGSMPTLKNDQLGIYLFEQLDSIAGDATPTGSANLHQSILKQKHLAILLKTFAAHAGDGAELSETGSVALPNGFKHVEFDR